MHRRQLADRTKPGWPVQPDGRLKTLLLAAALASTGATGYSEQAPTSAPDKGHITEPNPSVIGRHIYACDDRTQVAVVFLDDGLSIDVRSPLNEKPARLTAPAQGLLYVGDRITADASGSQMTIVRKDHAPQACRRI